MSGEEGWAGPEGRHCSMGNELGEGGGGGMGVLGAEVERGGGARNPGGDPMDLGSNLAPASGT